MLDTPDVAVLPIGLPGLPFHLRLDSLSAFFLMVIGAASAGISAFRGRLLPPGRGHAARACCAWSTTSSWPAWWAWCWPTTPTPSW
jgi:hydrogenase-4 component B